MVEDNKVTIPKNYRADQTKAAGISPNPSSVDGSKVKIPKKRSKKTRAEQTKAAEIGPKLPLAEENNVKIPEKSREDQTKTTGISPNSSLVDGSKVKIPKQSQTDRNMAKTSKSSNLISIEQSEAKCSKKLRGGRIQRSMPKRNGQI